MCKLWLFLTRPANAVYSVGIHVMSVLSSRQVYIYIVFFAGLFLCISFTGDGSRELGEGRRERGDRRRERGDWRRATGDKIRGDGGDKGWPPTCGTRRGFWPSRHWHFNANHAASAQLWTIHKTKYSPSTTKCTKRWATKFAAITLGRLTGSGPFHILIVQLSFAKKKVDFLELNSIEKAPQSWIMTAMDNQSFLMIKIQSVPCFQIMLIFLIRQSIPQYDRSPPPSAPLPTPVFYIVAVALTQYGH